MWSTPAAPRVHPLVPHATGAHVCPPAEVRTLLRDRAAAGSVSGYVHDPAVAVTRARALRAALPDWASLFDTEVVHVESALELCRLSALAHVRGRRVRVGLRVNPASVAVRLGGDADPYPALAGVLVAARYGIERDLQLPDPIRGTPGPGTAALPASLPEAADLLEGSAVARTGLGDGLVDALVAAARAEWAAYSATVREWERGRGFERR